MSFDVRYSQKNLAERDGMVDDLYARYASEIEARNKLDIELYNYLENSLLPRLVNEYGEGYQSNYERFESDLALQNEPILRRRMDYVFRKCYVEPVGGLIRVLHGLTAKGSY